MLIAKPVHDQFTQPGDQDRASVRSLVGLLLCRTPCRVGRGCRAPVFLVALLLCSLNMLCAYFSIERTLPITRTREP